MFGAQKLNFAEPLAAPAAARLVLGKISPTAKPSILPVETPQN